MQVNNNFINMISLLAFLLPVFSTMLSIFIFVFIISKLRNRNRPIKQSKEDIEYLNRVTKKDVIKEEKYCEYCGEKVEEGSARCPSCGARL